jgi:hypothetical protein
MTLSVTNLIDHCKQAYNAVGDSFFSDVWYYSMIWQAETELAIQGWVIETTLNTTSVTGTRELAWPSNCLGIREVKYDYKNLKKVSLDNDPITSVGGYSGTPNSYAVWENTIILFPTPSATGDAIQIRCYMSPDVISIPTAPLNVPDEYQIQLSYFVLSQMAFKDQNLSLGQIYLQKWEQVVERARQQRKRRLRADRNSRVKDVYFSDWAMSGGINGYR